MELSTQQELQHSLNVLSVGQANSWDDIELQYRKLIQRWHPDRNTETDQDVAQQKFIEINSAFKVIRQHYRKYGTVPTRIQLDQQGPLLGTKKRPTKKAPFFKNKLVSASVLCFFVVVTFSAIVWSLDSRLAANNRDRANAEKELSSAQHPTSEKSTSEALEPTVNSEFNTVNEIQQSSIDLSP